MLITLSTVTTHAHSHSHSHSHAPEHPHPHADIEGESAVVTRIHRLAMFLEAHFGEVELHMPEETGEVEQGEDSHEPSLLVRLDEADALVNLLSLVRRRRPIMFYVCLTKMNAPTVDRHEHKRGVAETRRNGAGHGLGNRQFSQ